MSFASILIVTRDNARTLARAVGDALRQEGADFEVLLYDDASGPEQHRVLEVIAEEYRAEIESGRLVLLRPSEHVGLGRGRNEAARHARGDLLLYVDGDGYAQPDWLAKMREVFHDASVAAAASTVVFAGCPELVNGQGCTMTRFADGKDLYSLQHVSTVSSQSEPVLYAMGCGLCVRRSAWEAVGGFDEDIVNYYDDADFCARLWRRGLRVMTVPGAVILHDTLAYTAPSRRKMFWNMRNRWLFMGKHWPLRWLLCNAILQCGFYVRYPGELIHFPVLIRAILDLRHSFRSIVRERFGPPSLGSSVEPGMILPSFRSPPALHFESQMLEGRIPQALVRMDWTDAGAFDAIGTYVAEDGSCCSLIPRGSVTVGLFAASAQARVRYEATASDVRVSVEVLDGGGSPIACDSQAAEGCVSVALSGTARQLRVSASPVDAATDPVQPLAVARLLEITQS